MRPIKVCFYVFFPGGGIGRYTHELASALCNVADVEPELICSPDFEWLESDAYKSWPGLAGISHPSPTIRRMRFVQGQFINPRRAIRYAAKRGADILHLSNINHLTFPLWQSDLEASKLRVVATAHDVERQKSIVNRGWEDKQLRAFYRFADAIFVHSGSQVEQLQKFAGVEVDKVHLVPHGIYRYESPKLDRIDLRRELGLPQSKQVALVFGQIRDEKNLEGLIRALPLTSNGPHVLVAGRAGSHHRDVEYYRGLAASIGVDDQITFLPDFIPEDEVGGLFVAADWVALPYRNTFTSQSGVLAIAAHFSRPVLVGSSPALRETIDTFDIGVACDGDSPQDLRDGIDRMVRRIEEGHSHEFRRFRGANSWETNADRTSDVYRHVVGRELGHEWSA